MSVYFLLRHSCNRTSLLLQDLEARSRQTPTPLSPRVSVLPPNGWELAWVWGIGLLGHAGHVRRQGLRLVTQFSQSCQPPSRHRSSGPTPDVEAPPSSGSNPSTGPVPASILLKPSARRRQLPQGPRSGRRCVRRRPAARQMPPLWARTPLLLASAPRPPEAAWPTSLHLHHRPSFRWAPPCWDRVPKTNGGRSATRDTLGLPGRPRQRRGPS